MFKKSKSYNVEKATKKDQSQETEKHQEPGKKMTLKKKHELNILMKRNHPHTEKKVMILSKMLLQKNG